MKLAIALFAFALASQAAGIDGHWTAETVARGKNAQAKKVSFTLDLKTTPEGQLTGSINLDSAKKPRAQTIRDAKVNGSTVTFTTRAATKKADTTFQWTLAINGDQLTGTRTREGAKHGQNFAGKRMN